MTNLTESSVFESGIYQLETDDPVLGGPPGFDAGAPVTGHANAQAQQLANRTKWLYDSKANIADLANTTDPAKGAGMVGITSPEGSATTVSEIIKTLNQEYPTAAFSNYNGLVTGPGVIKLHGKLRVTGDVADAAYNKSVLADALAGLPNGAELEFPARGLALCDGGLVVNSIGVTLRGSSGGGYDAFALKFTDTGDAITIAKPGFYASRIMLLGASNRTSGFGADVAHDCLNFQLASGVDIDAVLHNVTLAFFRDLLTVKNAPGRNIRVSDSLLSGSSRAFSYTALGSSESRDFEFYDCRFHGIGRASDSRSAIIYADPAANVRGVTIAGGLADFSTEIFRGYASYTNISNVPLKGAVRGYISADFTGHSQGLDRRGLRVTGGSYMPDLSLHTLASDAISLAGPGFYEVDGFISYGSSGHGVYVKSPDATISNTKIHNAGQFADNTYSGYFIDTGAARTVFSGGNEYRQDVKSAPNNKAKCAFENMGAATFFAARPYVYGMGSRPQYSATVLSYGLDPLAVHPRETTGSAAPTSGTWSVGDKVYSTTPATTGFVGWICTASGTPGTWKTFGAISA